MTTCDISGVVSELLERRREGEMRDKRREEKGRGL